MVSTEKSKRQKETKHEQIRIREIKRVVADEFRGDPPPRVEASQIGDEGQERMWHIAEESEAGLKEGTHRVRDAVCE